MDAPLGRWPGVRLLEDAVDLIRQAGAGSLVYHWMGSVPFAAGLLLGWNSATSSRTSDAAWAAESLLLAVAWVWMNCWRAVYAGKLRNHLSGVPDQPWTAARIFDLTVVQSFFGATRLLVLPFSVLIVFPCADVVAFYRSLAVLAGREDGSPREIARRARRLAKFQPAQNWAALALLVFLQGVLLVNLALVIGVVPQLIRILTGYESAYSRSGIYFLQNPVFALSVLSACWILFDPFAQAVYCVRTFQAETSETGEDLRCALRRIRAAAQVTAAAVLLVILANPARADVAPADLERSVHQAMQAPEYDWRLPAAPVAANTPWLARIVERIFSAIQHAADAVLDVLGRFLRWLLERLFPSRTGGQPGAPPGAGLNWTVAALIALVAAAGALFAWQRSRSRRSKPHTAQPPPLETVRLDAPDLAADLLTEDRWMELAERCLAEQNYRFALRAFYLACLAWLGRREFLSIHAGKTNHEYEKELNRRVRELPEARALFAGNVARFERAWYGAHTVSAEDAERFRQNTELLKGELAGLQGAAR